MGVAEERIDPIQDRLDRAEAACQIAVNPRAHGIVLSRRLEDVKVVPDGVLEARECSVVEEGGLQRGVAERRRPELVAVRRDYR